MHSLVIITVVSHYNLISVFIFCDLIFMLVLLLLNTYFHVGDLSTLCDEFYFEINGLCITLT